MVEGAARRMPSVGVYRPVANVDSIWLEAAIKGAAREKIVGVQWVKARHLRAILLDSVELANVLQTEEILLDEAEVQDMVIGVRRHLQATAESAPEARFYPLTKQCLWSDIDPGLSQLALAHIPSTVAWERELVLQFMQRRYGIAPDHPYWLPTEACAVRLAEGKSEAVAAAHTFLEPPIPRLFTPAVLRLGGVVVGHP